MKTLVISFSGGKTSAYMTFLLLQKYKGKRDVIVVFVNTGKEREETLEFVRRCDEGFGFDTIWIEAITNPIRGKGCDFKIVTFETAARNGEPFELLIKKEGVPNQNFPFCSERLKKLPVKKLLKRLKIKDYEMAIGIRIDEPKRLKPKPHVIYPLAKEFPTTKIMVSRWWLSQSFTLELKGYEGNCNLCWKKSKRKLLTILAETPTVADWWNRMEIEHGNGFTFFRDEYSTAELLEESKQPFRRATDDFSLTELMHSEPELDFTNGCGESCEAF